MEHKYRKVSCIIGAILVQIRLFEKFWCKNNLDYKTKNEFLHQIVPNNGTFSKVVNT